MIINGVIINKATKPACLLIENNKNNHCSIILHIIIVGEYCASKNKKKLKSIFYYEYCSFISSNINK